MVKRLKKIGAKDEELNQVQGNLDEWTKQLELPILDGQLVENISLTSGSTTAINHGLSRAIRGWFVVKQNASAIIWAVDANQTLPIRQLVLSTSANVTINLWVF
jgi:hypothetical protein